MPSPVIIDSECANLNSVYKAAMMVGLDPIVSDDLKIISSAGALIFPGVGSFDHAVSIINRKNLAEVLMDAIAAEKPFLGICLGMQLLFSSSEEARSPEGPTRGLNVIPGKVKRFPPGLPVPHVGWNKVDPALEHPLFSGLKSGPYFYFTHSYYARPEAGEHILALTEYGFPFTSAVCRGNLFGVQFHPEKSGTAGLRLLANFGRIITDRR